MRELKILDVPSSYVHELSNVVFGTISKFMYICFSLYTVVNLISEVLKQIAIYMCTARLISGTKIWQVFM